jgi:uncharacterized membrane protein
VEETAVSNDNLNAIAVAGRSLDFMPLAMLLALVIGLKTGHTDGQWATAIVAIFALLAVVAAFVDLGRR